jgi:choline-sulfatase
VKRLLLAAAAVAALAFPAAALAHPLGNFTINRFSRVEVAGPQVYVDYVLDLAEIPTFQAGRIDAAALARLRAHADERWDLERLTRDVVASQRRRLFVSEALGVGAHSPWDFSPPDGSSGRYVRGRDFWAPFGRARLRHD